MMTFVAWKQSYSRYVHVIRKVSFSYLEEGVSSENRGDQVLFPGSKEESLNCKGGIIHIS